MIGEEQLLVRQTIVMLDFLRDSKFDVWITEQLEMMLTIFCNNEGMLRIYRVFEGSKTTIRPSYMYTSSSRVVVIDKDTYLERGQCAAKGWGCG